MENFKKGFIPFKHGIHLFKGMSPKTPREREREHGKDPLCLGYRESYVCYAMYKT